MFGLERSFSCRTYNIHPTARREGGRWSWCNAKVTWYLYVLQYNTEYYNRLISYAFENSNAHKRYISSCHTAHDDVGPDSGANPRLSQALPKTLQRGHHLSACRVLSWRKFKWIYVVVLKSPFSSPFSVLLFRWCLARSCKLETSRYHPHPWQV